MDIESRTVRMTCGTVVLEGELATARACSGVVIFAHGSGSGRHSPRNQMVAARLQQRGIATLLLDLLTQEEERVDLHTRHFRFDIPLLAARMVCATRWAAAEPRLSGLPIGYFGASTGSAAALIAAAELGGMVAAVVSRGGRPDLAGDAVLARVSCPTLLIVGGEDHGVIELNEQAFGSLRAAKRLEIVPGATHLFEEPGTLDRVSELAGDWFREHLVHSEMEQ